MDFNLSTYYPVFIYLAFVLAFCVAVLLVTHMPRLKPKKQTKVKLMPYESGMDPIGDARQRFDIKFYLVAILFLVFDVELLFLYPWAVAAYGGADDAALPLRFRTVVFGVVISFLATLAVAYVYAWRKGVFKWR
jgi:NADH:ubiquinone oxidoreductase subunit 3 (subunit A)